jgi:hypothetical protein
MIPFPGNQENNKTDKNRWQTNKTLKTSQQHQQNLSLAPSLPGLLAPKPRQGGPSQNQQKQQNQQKSMRNQQTSRLDNANKKTMFDFD